MEDAAWELWRATRDGNEARLRELLVGTAMSEIDWTNIDRFQNTPLHIASRNGRLSCVGLLLDAGAEVNCRNRRGSTALNLAALGNHPSVVSALLAAGAQIDLATIYGDTPLTTAALNGHSGVVKLLLEEGANREHKTASSQTALDLAVEDNHQEAAAILMEHERAERVVRPVVVAALSSIMPEELAQLCADFISFPEDRRRMLRQH